MKITLPFYEAVVDLRGARLESLCMTGGHEWSGVDGIGEDAEGGFPGQLRQIAYAAERTDSESEIRLACVGHGIPGGMIDWGMTVRKNFRFYRDRPEIEVCLRIENAGSRAKSFTSFRVHNAIRPDVSAQFFTGGVSGMDAFAFEPGTHRYVKRFARGVAGCFSPAAGQALVFQTHKSAIQQFLFFIGANVCTVEWYLKRLTVPARGFWEMRYRMLAVPAKTGAAINALLEDDAFRLYEAEKPAKRVGLTEPQARQATQRDAFSQLAAQLLSRQAVAQAGDFEQDVATADGWRHDRVLRTPRGGGFEVKLPDVPTIAVQARVSLPADRQASAEACLICCDPDGNPCAASAPVRLDTWNSSTELTLDVSLLRGKAVRLGLLGPDAVWTDLRVCAGVDSRVLFSALSMKYGDPVVLAGVEANLRKLSIWVRSEAGSPDVRVCGYDADGDRLKDEPPRFVRNPDPTASGEIGLIEPAESASVEIEVREGGRRVQSRLDMPSFVAAGLSDRAVRIDVLSPGGSIDVAAADHANTVLSLEAARDRIRQLRAGGNQGAVTVRVHGGVHRLKRPFTLRSADGGTAQAPVVYRAEAGAQVVLSGGRNLKGPWRAECDGTWVCDWPRGLAGFRSLALEDRPLPRSRWPHKGELNVEPAGCDASGRPRFRVLSHVLADAPDLSQAEFVARYTWCGERFDMVEVDRESGVITLSRPLNRVRRVISSCHFENVLDPDLPQGHWYADAAARRIVYRPRPTEDCAGFAPVAPHLQELVLLRGDANGRKVRHVHFQGFECRDVQNGEQDEGTQAAVRIGGAIVLENAEWCGFEKNRLRFMEGAGIELRSGCTHNLMQGNELSDLGDGGIRIGLGYLLRDRDARIDRLPSTGANVVAGNHVHHVGLRHCGAVGIWIGQSGGNRVVENRVDHLPYTGISAGWTWGRGDNPAKGNRIERNIIHDVMLEMHDGAGIYTLGASPGTTICGNRIRNVPNGNAIYLDEGSAGILVSGNDARSHRVGLYLHGACRNRIEGNYWRNATQAALLFADCAGQMRANTFDGNRFERGDAGGLFIRAVSWHARFLAGFSGNRMQGWPKNAKAITGIDRVTTLTAFSG